MQRTDLSGEAKAGAITADVESIMARSWSCVDLHHSVFLAPDQIRTCCKRFFVDGVMQGDVALMDVPENGAAAVSADSILAAKRELHAAINRGDKTACSGCPFLEFKDWGPLDKLQLNYLSMEQHSRCNLKCTYCSETYYGGVAPRYDVRSLVDQLIDDESLAPDGTVVWGGGEPAMDRNFIPVITRLAERLPGLTQRVLTNSVARSATVEKLLAEGRIVVTSSVDAGTEETYDRVRGKPRLASTITTLKKYAAAGAARITIKYIFTEGNESAAEVRAFAALVEEAGLMGCNYQISADFKKETVTRTALASMILLYGLLIEAGAKVVFFDDLLRHRLIGMASEEEAAIRAMLADLGAPPTLADIDEHAAIAIWGAGWQAKYLLERASFFKKVKVAFFVDSTPAKIGTQFLGIDVRDPAELLGSDIPVLIAAVQGYPLIYGQYKKLGVADSRLIRGLVI